MMTRSDRSCHLSLVACVTLILYTSSAVYSQESEFGEWSNLSEWPTEAIHSILTPRGKVLVWGWGLCDGPPQEDTHLWTPPPPDQNPPPVDSLDAVFPGEDFFCSGHAALPDGRVLVVGGGCHHAFHNKALKFHPSTGWECAEPMKYARWYPTLTTLPDGRVLATSGNDEQDQLVLVPEIYDPEVDVCASPGSAWTELPGASRAMDLYPLMFVAPDGRVFHAGRTAPGAHCHAFLDVETQTWSDCIDDAHQWGTRSSAVMYAPGKILKAGGESGGKQSKTIDLNQANPSWSIATYDMHVERVDLDLIVLPNGFVLAVGGNIPEDPEDPQEEPGRRVEWINPTALEPTWFELAMTNAAREYHSTTLLLPDGRVLAAGGDFTNAEIFSPPYLFTGTPRPVIDCAPDQIHYGASFYIDVGEDVSPEGVAAVNLVRLGSITHGFDQDTRFVPLTDSPLIVDGNRLYVPAPANANIAPPGHYMVFLISDQGVPSVAAIVQVTHCPPEGCPADLDEDGVVGVFDLLALLACWGEVPDPDPENCAAADLNGDDVINVFDLLDLLAAWGPCDCDTECAPASLNDCWNRYHNDIERYEACVEWVAERETYFPTN